MEIDDPRSPGPDLIGRGRCRYPWFSSWVVRTGNSNQNGVGAAFRVKWPDAELLIEIRYR